MQRCHTYLETYLLNFEKKEMKKADTTTQHWFSNTYIKFFKEAKKKAEKTDATMQHWFSHIYILPPNKAEFPLYTGSFHHATMPHIFWNAPIKFWAKRWKILTQPRNTYFRTHITNFLTKLKKTEKADTTMQHCFLMHILIF